MPTPQEISFQELLDALLDTDNPFHPRFLYRLSDLDNTELALLEGVWDSVPLWRRQALLEDLEELGSTGLLLSFEAIARFAIEDEDPGVRTLAVQILWDFEASDLIPCMLNMMAEDPSAEARAATATALGRFVYLGEIDEIPERSLHQIAERLLQAAAEDQAELVCRRSLEALGYSSRPEVPGLIERAFSSGKRDWMKSALFAMGRSIDERWTEKVVLMLEHRLPALRAEAARAAGELEIAESLPFLFELVEDSDEDVRQAAIWSLSQIGGEGVRQLLEELWEDAEDDQEIEVIENALDNLAFTEDMELFSLFDFPEQDLDQDGNGLLLDEETFPDIDIGDDEEFLDIDDEDLLD